MNETELLINTIHYLQLFKNIFYTQTLNNFYIVFSKYKSAVGLLSAEFEFFTKSKSQVIN